MGLWTKGGALVVSDGTLITCEVFPCITDPGTTGKMCDCNPDPIPMGPLRLKVTWCGEVTYLSLPIYGPDPLACSWMSLDGPIWICGPFDLSEEGDGLGAGISLDQVSIECNPEFDLGGGMFEPRWQVVCVLTLRTNYVNTLTTRFFYDGYYGFGDLSGGAPDPYTQSANNIVIATSPAVETYLLYAANTVTVEDTDPFTLVIFDGNLYDDIYDPNISPVSQEYYVDVVEPLCDCDGSLRIEIEPEP